MDNFLREYAITATFFFRGAAKGQGNLRLVDYCYIPSANRQSPTRMRTHTRGTDTHTHTGSTQKTWTQRTHCGNPGRRRLRFPKQTLEHSCGATVLSLQLTKERGNQTVTQVISTVGQKGRGVPGAGPSVRSAWLPLPASPATVSPSAPSRREPHG